MPLQRMASETSISSSTTLALYNMSLDLREDADILLKRQWHERLNVISDISQKPQRFQTHDQIVLPSDSFERNRIEVLIDTERDPDVST